MAPRKQGDQNPGSTEIHQPPYGHGKYNPEEACFLVNWLDKCIVNGATFLDTIEKELQIRFQQTRTAHGAEKKLMKLMKQLPSNLKLTDALIRKQGSKLIAWNRVSLDEAELYNAGRVELGLPLLDVGSSLM
jgi:hypothetical protein